MMRPYIHVDLALIQYAKSLIKTTGSQFDSFGSFDPSPVKESSFLHTCPKRSYLILPDAVGHGWRMIASFSARLPVTSLIENLQSLALFNDHLTIEHWVLNGAKIINHEVLSISSCVEGENGSGFKVAEIAKITMKGIEAWLNSSRNSCLILGFSPHEQPIDCGIPHPFRLTMTGDAIRRIINHSLRTQSEYTYAEMPGKRTVQHYAIHGATYPEQYFYPLLPIVESDLRGLLHKEDGVFCWPGLPSRGYLLSDDFEPLVVFNPHTVFLGTLVDAVTAIAQFDAPCYAFIIPESTTGANVALGTVDDMLSLISIQDAEEDKHIPASYGRQWDYYQYIFTIQMDLWHIEAQSGPIVSCLPSVGFENASSFSD